MEHPFSGIVGLPGHGVLRADQPVRPARGVQGVRRRLPPGRNRRDPRLGARAISRRTRTASRSFDGTALYEHADPRQGEHRDWGTLIFNYGRNEVRNFLLSNALFWLEEYHIDGLRVDAVASMLYLDYSRQAGAVGPQPVRRAREPRGDRLPAAAEHAVARASIPARSRSPRSRPPGRRSAGRRYLGGLGFTFKWNMGWMHDMLRLRQAGSGLPALAPQRHHLLAALRLHARTSSCRSRTTRWCTARDRCSGRCRATTGRSRRRCARCTATCTRTPARSCCSWACEFGQWREWNDDRSLDWHLLDAVRCTAGCAGSSRT